MTDGGDERFQGRRALITGVTGQDGAFLASLLLDKGYHVIGTTRKIESANFWRLGELGIRNHERLSIVELDVADSMGCLNVVRNANPREVYNLGGQSFIGQSFADPLSSGRVTGLGAWHLLEAIRTSCPETRFFQASSSEMFGDADFSPQDENTRFVPRSPYAAAKAFAHWATISYKDAFGMFATSGILYNHESRLRGIEFVTRKITLAVARVCAGSKEVLKLGNLDVQRDWGFAPEYVEAMWRTLQLDSPNAFVLATGCLTTVRGFVQAAFRAGGIELNWSGCGLREVGVDAMSGRVLVRVAQEFFRPAEESPLCGNPERARLLLGWTAKTKVEEICRIMVDADIERLQTGQMQ